jgi:ketosteroid isomerase-like protein
MFMETTTPKQVALAMYQAISDRDVPRFFSCLSDDVRITLYGSHRLARTFKGKDDIRSNMFGPVVERLEAGIRFTFKSVIAEGNHVAIEADGSARTKDGRDYRNAYCFVVRVENGKVVESREYMDTELAKAVIG